MGRGARATAGVAQWRDGVAKSGEAGRAGAVIWRVRECLVISSALSAGLCSMAAGFERGSGLFGRGSSGVASSSGTRLGIRTKPEAFPIWEELS